MNRRERIISEVTDLMDGFIEKEISDELTNNVNYPAKIKSFSTLLKHRIKAVERDLNRLNKEVQTFAVFKKETELEVLQQILIDFTKKVETFISS